MMNEEVFRKIAQRVRDFGGVLTIKMVELKKAGGDRRLKRVVREEILSCLRKCGLNVIGEIPNSQTDEVRIYEQASPAGEIVEAFLEPGSKGDEIIRRLAKAAAGKIPSMSEETPLSLC